ncbi:MAG: hypothetical protein L6R38_007780 [Xanthoria sp. 2 TBL-2021]|nr:MAG: hypothetical protein L6R38_007780 [Xanthoria sp. 2 TBL-2021]
MTKLPGANDTAASFQFDQEDHTLGNALRFMIMKNPEVELCGIQTYEGTTVYEALEKGLVDLMDLCDVVTTKFTDARDDFAASMDTQ